MGKNLSNKNGQKLLHSTKKSTIAAIKSTKKYQMMKQKTTM